MEDNTNTEDNLETVQKWFDEASEESKFDEFEKIKNKHSNRPDLHALIMLDKLFDSACDMISCAEHDEVFLDISTEDIATLTKEQVYELVACGVYYSSDVDSLHMFV